MASDLEIVITAKDEASGDIKKISGNLDELDGSAQRAGGGVNLLSGALQVGLVAGIGAAIAAGAGLVNLLKESVTEGIAAQEAQSQLAAVLKSTGGAAGMTSDELTNLASSLQAATTFGDEEILNAESLMLTFTNIGKDVFPMATSAVLDMSQALGQDLKSSSIQLGKALNDPIAGVGALSRVGVQFTEEQKEQIKVLVESGDTMGAQKLILAELAKEFGGSATAAAGTFSGQMKQMENQIGDAKEEIGLALIPVLSDLAKTALPVAIDMIKGVAAVLKDLLDPTTDAGKGMKEFGTMASGIFTTVKGVVDELTKSWKLAWPVISGYVTTAKTAIGKDIDSIMTSLGKIAGWFGAGGKGSQTGYSMAQFWADLAFMVTNTASAISNTISSIVNTFALLGDAIRALSSGDWGKLGSIVGQLAQVIPSLYGMNMPVVGMIQSIMARQTVPGRALGGPVSAGSGYLVGENGPELFIPRNNGDIVPNRSTATTNNFYVTLPGGGSNPNTIETVRTLQALYGGA